MISGTSLLNKIPIQVQQPQVVADIPAAVSVADVLKNDDTKETKGLFQRFVDNLKERYMQRRIKKLESKPVEQLSQVEKAELEANKKASSQAAYLA